MLAAVQIPKQGLPARQEVSTHGPASASFALEAAGSGAVLGAAGDWTAGIVGVVANMSSENMFGPLLGSLLTAVVVSMLAVPTGAVLRQGPRGRRVCQSGPPRRGRKSRIPVLQDRN